jgi:hypothetical protein
MARRLATLGFSREMFAEGPIVSGAERYATHQVLTLVERTFEEAPIGFDGRRRREFSLASKVLHWLLPWRIPAYDSFVRKAVHVSDEDGATAYPKVARRVIARARHAERPISKEWIGLYPPDSPLRAVDKQLWWYGGGNKGTARVVHNPWAVIDHLGLDRLGLDRISTARQLQGG